MWITICGLTDSGHRSLGSLGSSSTSGYSQGFCARGPSQWKTLAAGHCGVCSLLSDPAAAGSQRTVSLPRCHTKQFVPRLCVFREQHATQSRKAHFWK